MNILEIGANVGYYTLISAKIIKGKGHIYAFEPAPFNFRSLVANVNINGFEDVVEFHREGIADKKGTLTFYLYSKCNLIQHPKCMTVVQILPNVCPQSWFSHVWPISPAACINTYPSGSTTSTLQQRRYWSSARFLSCVYVAFLYQL